MHRRQYRCAPVLALSLFALPALANPPPWQVNGLGTYSPSGRPGNSNDWYIHVNISHANPRKGAAQDDDSSTVSCRPTWQWPALPYNVIYDCEIVGAAGHWIWTVEPLEADNDESPWPTTNFGLRWRAAASTNHTAKKDGVRIWTGVGQFEVGKNMQGTCAASGFCVWGLKPESNPVLVDVASLLCQGTLEEALKGINCP